MTSLRRRTAKTPSRAPAPKTEDGKQRSRRHAFRHGFTAETVIEPLENPEQYRVFEGAIVSSICRRRRFVHRLASLLRALIDMRCRLAVFAN
jgi:hypothetical protein